MHQYEGKMSFSLSLTWRRQWSVLLSSLQMAPNWRNRAAIPRDQVRLEKWAGRSYGKFNGDKHEVLHL